MEFDKTFSIGELYNITQISRQNNKMWEEIYKLIKDEDEKEAILLDFDDVQLERPWDNLNFIKIMQKPNIYIKIYNSDRIKATIDIVCGMGGMKTGRVINEDIIYSINKEEEQLERVTKKFENELTIVGDAGYINLANIIGQIGENKTVNGLSKALDNFKEKNPEINRFEIETESLPTQRNAVKLLADMVVEKGRRGIVVYINNDDYETMGLINKFIVFNRNKRLSYNDKLKAFLQIKPKTVGLLGRYKETRRIDEFGCMGDGQYILNRPAIFEGIKNYKKGQITGDEFLVFSTFNFKNFCTRYHYALDNDMEEHPGLIVETFRIKVNQIGLKYEFLGSLYHFNTAEQLTDDGYIEGYVEDQSGSITLIKRTIPDTIKLVFDDFNVVYNKEELQKDIDNTNAYLIKMVGRKNK